MKTGLFAAVALGAALALFVVAVPGAEAQDNAAAAGASAVAAGAAQQPQEAKPWMDIYGFAMLDIGENFTQIHPDWFDTLRVTKLPSYKDEFGKDGQTFAGVRQSRFGVKTGSSTPLGELKTQFEFEMFGTGVDSGQTTIRLRHAYGQLGHVGAGQTWSPFMDPDVFPNTLEYWGPTGMVFFRNVQVRYMTTVGDNQLTVALERPGASGDQGIYADRIELSGIKARFPLPDLSANYRLTRGWGHVQVAGMLRRIYWDDTLADQYDLSGSATGWGINLSSNLKPSKADVVHLQFVYGEGIQNYMNDSPVDIGIKNNTSDPTKPILGIPLPIFGALIFCDHQWTDRWASSAGYSYQINDNSSGQAPNAFHSGHYLLANLLYSPLGNVMMGGEFQWGRRVNNSDGFHSDGVKLQFSFKYNFSHRLGG